MSREKKRAVAERLAYLTVRGNGRLTPLAVVLDAEDPASPLHDHFEWSDEKAAAKYRLEQARSLIRSVRVEETVHRQTVSVIAYVHDPSSHNEQGYIPVVSLIGDKEQARRVLEVEFSRVVSVLQRSHDIARTLGLEEELLDLLSSVNAFADMVKKTE